MAIVRINQKKCIYASLDSKNFCKYSEVDAHYGFTCHNDSCSYKQTECPFIYHDDVPLFCEVCKKDKVDVTLIRNPWENEIMHTDHFQLMCEECYGRSCVDVAFDK
jgi:hypothetical protein